MKRQRAFLAQDGVSSKKPKLVRSNATLTAAMVPWPRPPALTPVQKAQVTKLILNKEQTKYFDNIMGPTGVSTAGVTSSLFTVPQGVAENQRIGDSVRLLSCSFRIQLAAADATNQFRIVMWSYKQNTALGAPTNLTPLEVGPSSGTLAEPVSQYNWLNRKLYKIHWDKTYSTVLNSDNNVIQIADRFNLPPKLQNVQFISGGSNAVNQLFITYFSDSAAVTHPTMQGTWRCFFKDS